MNPYKSVCSCNSLRLYLLDPSIPIELNEKDKYCYLGSKDGEKVKINYCFVCGGNKRGPLSESSKECSCNSVSKFFNKNVYPIGYNNDFNEFFVIGDGNSQSLLYFCFVCGGRLSESKRGDFFTIPSHDEMSEVTAKLQGVHEIEEYKKVLGNPDEEFGPIIANHASKEVYGLKNTKRTLVYKSLGKTLELLVQENEDGKVTYFFAGKPKTGQD